MFIRCELFPILLVRYVPAFGYQVYTNNNAGYTPKVNLAGACVFESAFHRGVLASSLVCMNVNGAATSCTPDITSQNMLVTAAESIPSLAGIAIGDGFSVPRVMVQGYADLLWQVGMLDDNQWVIARQYQDQIVAAIDGGNNSQAFRIWDSFLNGDLIPYPPW